MAFTLPASQGFTMVSQTNSPDSWAVCRFLVSSILLHNHVNLCQLSIKTQQLSSLRLICDIQTDNPDNPV